MPTLVLNNVSLTTTPLRDVISAASSAGFDAMSVMARSYRYAIERAGLTNADIRALVADHGITITDVEAATDWLTPEGESIPTWVRAPYTTDELLVIAEELGATTLTTFHWGTSEPLDVAAEKFARLCDRAADAGLRIALEFPAWMTIASLQDAWEVVRTADRPNGGLLVDIWHHRRSDGDDSLLRTLPPESIFSVQLADGTAVPRGALIDDVRNRMLLGDGELDIVGFLRTLADMGVDAPVGIEVFDAELVASGADHAARVLYQSLHKVVAQATS
jgi:sugar phosphate isomerase/epimerase